MIIIGLCGGSGSGKGTVAKLFELHNIPNINADEVYRDLTKVHGALIPTLAKEFGSDVIAADGSLDRKRLANIVFTSEGQDGKLQRLNVITHKAILEETEKKIADFEEAGADAVIFDAPLLFESGFHKKCNVIIAVLADKSKRAERIMKRDSISKTQAEARIASQLPDGYLRDESDYIIVNNGELYELEEQVKAIAEEIFNRGKENERKNDRQGNA